MNPRIDLAVFLTKTVADPPNCPLYRHHNIKELCCDVLHIVLSSASSRVLVPERYGGISFAPWPYARIICGLFWRAGALTEMPSKAF
jgi:hypothetical protein